MLVVCILIRMWVEEGSLLLRSLVLLPRVLGFALFFQILTFFFFLFLCLWVAISLLCATYREPPSKFFFLWDISPQSNFNVFFLFLSALSLSSNQLIVRPTENQPPSKFFFLWDISPQSNFNGFFCFSLLCLSASLSLSLSLSLNSNLYTHNVREPLYALRYKSSSYEIFHHNQLRTFFCLFGCISLSVCLSLSLSLSLSE